VNPSLGIVHDAAPAPLSRFLDGAAILVVDYRPPSVKLVVRLELGGQRRIEFESLELVLLLGSFDLDVVLLLARGLFIQILGLHNPLGVSLSAIRQLEPVSLFVIDHRSQVLVRQTFLVGAHSRSLVLRRLLLSQQCCL